MTTRQAGGAALVLVVISLFLMAAFRTVELVEERQSLHGLHDLQENPLRQAATVRGRFDALANGVVTLSAGGDAGARLVVEAMRRQGVVLAAKKP